MGNRFGWIGGYPGGVCAEPGNCFGVLFAGGGKWHECGGSVNWIRCEYGINYQLTLCVKVLKYVI